MGCGGEGPARLPSRLPNITAGPPPASMEMSMTGGPPFPNKRRKASSGPSKALAIAPGDDPAQRHTGIRLMGDMPWGTHICLFHETPEDLLDTAVCYFEAGLKSNEFCVWAISDPVTETDARDALRLAVPNLDELLEAGQLEILQASEWYLKGGQFDLMRITSGWSEKLQG